MRTEIKVGLIVGLVLIAGGGILWSMNRGGDTKADLPFDARAGGTGDTQAVRHEAPAPPPTARDARPAQPASRTPTTPPATTPPTSAAPRTGAPPAGSGATPTGGSSTATPPSGTPTTPPRAPDAGSTPSGARPTGAPTTPPPTTPASTPPTTPASGTDRPGAAPAETRAPTTPGSAAKPATNAPVNVPPRGAAPAVDTASAAKPSASDKPASATTYTVADTDTLSTIAHDKYGDAKYWTAIVAANPGIKPDHIRVGQVLNLPSKEDVLRAKTTPKPDAGASGDSHKPGPTAPGSDTARAGSTTPPSTPKPATPASGAGRTYKVVKGDTLSSIARHELKDENRWQEIFDLNKDKLASPDNLVEGMELKLPDK